MDFSGDTIVGFRVFIFLTGGDESVLFKDILSVRILSLEDVSGVFKVEGCEGLLLGEEEVPCAAHLASILALLFDPGGRPTVKTLFR
jgi:hypothetical protein